MTTEEIAKGTVAEISERLPILAGWELAELHDLEEAKDNPRVTLLDAIHREQDDRKEAAGGVPLDAAMKAEYDRGRMAYRRGIAEDQCPHGAGPRRDAWAEGWRFQAGS